MKRIFKGPWLWVVLAAIGVLLAIQFLAPSDGYDEINTSRMNEYIAQGEVDEITFVDGDQEIRATLDKGVREGSDKVMAFWLTNTQDDIERAVQEQVAAGDADVEGT